MAWTAVPAFILDQLFGYQTANYLRDNLIALASARHKYPLGGSRELTLDRLATVQDAKDWVDVELDGTNLGGLTVRARIEVRTLAAGTSITPRVQNITDATTAGTGVACTATNADYTGTNQKQTVTLTVAAGIKTYRLQATLGNLAADAFVIGYIEAFATA